MTTKQSTENTRIDDLIGQIFGGARLFLSGGQEHPLIALKAGVEDAAKQVLNRLYPKFNDDGDPRSGPGLKSQRGICQRIRASRVYGRSSDSPGGCRDSLIQALAKLG